MSIFWKIILVIAAVATILACSLASNTVPASQSDVATIVAGTLQGVTEAARTTVTQPASMPSSSPAPIPAATLGSVPQGLKIGYLNVKLTISPDLGRSTTNTSTTDVEFPFVNPSLGDMPQHTKIVLNDYPVHGAILQPQILVFNADDYSQYSDLTKQIVSGLRTLHYQNGQSLPEGLLGGQFSAAIQEIPFASGNGIRYLTQFNESPLPANNHELIYYFHGITQDGKYYVEVILPTQAPFLAPDDNPNSPIPANGIPFHSDQAYYSAVQQKLNATAQDQYSPPLASLDALIHSITITP